MMYREICTHKGNLKNLLLEGIDDQVIIQSLVAVSKKNNCSVLISAIST